MLRYANEGIWHTAFDILRGLLFYLCFRLFFQLDSPSDLPTFQSTRDDYEEKERSGKASMIVEQSLADTYFLVVERLLKSASGRCLPAKRHRSRESWWWLI